MSRVLMIAGVLSLAWTSVAIAQTSEKVSPESSRPQAAVSDSETLGISKTKPESGPFVEVDGIFMVPYKTKIPGTEVAFEMIPIAGGKFQMGSPQDEEDRRNDEGPQIEVTMEPFWIGKYEVTWAEYRVFMSMDATFKQFREKQLRDVNENNQIDAITAPSSLYDPTFTFMAGSAPNQPCATVSQFAAKQYTKFLSLLHTNDFYRLPTEAEWEYACRAGTTTRFYFGDDVDELEDHAWFIDNSDEERHAVGKKKPNPWGLYDMYGNVAEWTLDAYSDQGYQQWVDKSAAGNSVLTESDSIFPRVLRGGSFELEAEDCRSAARMPSNDDEWKATDPNFPQSPWWFTDSPALGTGFRLVRPFKAPSTKEARDAFWKADVQEIVDAYKSRMKQGGKGALGIVDPSLPEAINQIKK